MSKQQHKNTNTANLQNLSTEQLRNILKELENQHDIIEAKNQELGTHVSDMRAVIKQVEKQKDSELNYTINKKKKLQDQIQRTEAALNVAHSSKNTMYADMVAFRELHDQ